MAPLPPKKKKVRNSNCRVYVVVDKPQMLKVDSNTNKAVSAHNQLYKMGGK